MTTHSNELTLRAILLGIFLAIVLSAANVYLGLFAGMTVSASIPAAVLSMALLKALGRSGVLENNIVQTAASAGESLAAGAIFTFPAIVILGEWQQFHYGQVTLIAVTGGLLGVLFTVPLRRALIVDQPLPYPEGTATAEVLKAGHEPHGDNKTAFRWLLIGAGVGALLKLAISGLKIIPAALEAATLLAGKTVFYIGSSTSAALVGVGYIVGFNIAILIFIGGALAWFIAIPLYSTLFAASDPALIAAANDGAAALAWQIWTSKIRYLGVGAMLVGGVAALAGLRKPLVASVRASLKAVAGDTEKDLPFKWVVIGTGLLTLPVIFIYQNLLGSFALALPMAALMIVAAFLFCAVGAWMAGLVGSSHNPVSATTIATILLTSLLLLVLGITGTAGVVAAILMGAIVCCAAAIGGDNTQDLKAGHLLGATPWKQQLMQCIGVIAAALVLAPVLNLLLAAYGFGAPTEALPNALPAPQATLMASVADGILGTGDIPWLMVAAGVAIGLAILTADHWLARRNSNFRMPVLAVAVGIYLPLELALPIALGGLISLWFGDAGKPAKNAVLLAAGLITGEALLGILLAIPAAAGNGDIFNIGLMWSPMGLAALALTAGLLVAARR